MLSVFLYLGHYGKMKSRTWGSAGPHLLSKNLVPGKRLTIFIKLTKSPIIYNYVRVIIPSLALEKVTHNLNLNFEALCFAFLNPKGRTLGSTKTQNRMHWAQNSNPRLSLVNTEEKEGAALCCAVDGQCASAC